MPVAIGGNLTTISVSGITYNVHTFTTSGTLTFTSPGQVEYLIVAGGGGGGFTNSYGGGGGGGAGGLLSGTTTVLAQNYSIVVGAGGTGTRSVPTNGSNSAALSLTAIGGGFGGYAGVAPGNGGSGGGGSGDNTAAGTGTAGQGNSGGAGGTGGGGNQGAGGGGGAGTAGVSRSGGTAGAGGSGLTSSITGTSIFYAGGGGGGASNGGAGAAGGAGGGGAGNVSTDGTAGTANTGGGGGGGSQNYSTNTNVGGAGGSGVVIIRYIPDSNSTTTYLSATGGTTTTTVTTSLNSRTTYRTHLFTTSGNLVVTQSGIAEYLIVGGGGGGGSDMGGGGGAGGYLAGNVSLSPGTYTVTIGAGGIGAPAGISQVRGSTGSSSSLVPVGFKGHSYSFDGSGDGINCGTQSAYAIGSGAFCLEGWVYNHRLKNYSTLWTTRPDNGSHAGAYHIGWDGAGGCSLYVGSTSYAGGAAGSIKAGQWQHIAVTRNASGNLAFFVDGIRVGYTASLTTNFTNSLLGLGDFPTTKAEGIDGYISNARIVVGNPVYDPTLTTCTVPTAPLTAISGTVILTAQDLAFQDNSANNFTLTAQGNAALSHYSPFHLLGAAGGGGGASEYSNNSSPASSGGSGGGTAGDASTTFGLGIAGQGFAGGASGGRYYPSGGGGAAAAGTGNPGNGGIGRQNAILGINYYWAGGGGGAGYSGNPGNGGLGGGGGGAPRQGSTAGIGGGSAFNPGADATVGTLGAQTNVPGGNGGTNTGGGGGGGAHYNSNNFGGTGGSGIVVVRYITAVESAGAGGQGGPNAGGGGGAGNDGYIGRSITYQAKVFTSSANLVVNSSSPIEYLIVGGGGGGGSDMGGGGGGGGYLAGTTTLSAGTYLVTVGAGGTGAPGGTDQVRANSGTSSGIVPFNYKGHSIIFDSTGDYITVPAQTALSFDTGDFTLEGWIYIPVAPSGYAAFIDGRNATSDAYAFGVNSSLKLDFYYGTPGRVTSTSSVALNQWTHCAVSRSSGTIRLFINGVLDATTGSYASAVNATRAAPLIGALIDPGFFSGLISNFRVIKGTAIYTSSFSVPTAPLTAITGTSVLLAQDLTFRDNSTNNFTVTSFGNATTSHFSPFHNLGAAGGGGGASDHTGPAATSAAAFGGSGGGASGNNANNGLGIPGQGNQGAASAGAWYPGGGGGAGQAGSTNPANGGNGLQNAILGTSYYWAAGGGGAGYSGNPGNGGLGGGGGGAPKQSSTAGVAGTGGYQAGTDGTSGSLNSQTNVPGGNGGTNTGSGGGGGSHYVGTNQGGSGGSGIVIIKYRTDLASITTVASVLTLTVSQLDTSYGGGQGANGAALYSGTAGSLFGGGGGGSGTAQGGGGGGIGVIGVRDGIALGGTAGGANGGDGQAGIFGYAGSNGNGGLYGGGGGGTTYSVVDPSVGNGAPGALVIFWQGNLLQYPTVLLANNTTSFGTSGNTNSGMLNSGVTLESLEAGTSGNTDTLLRLETRSESRTTANSNLGILTDTIANANIKAVIGLNSVTTNASSTAVNNIAVQELQIITYRTDDEMMLVTVQNTGGYTNSAQRIDRVTEENDPRRVKAYLLNYIVGVTGEDNDIIQTQIWF